MAKSEIRNPKSEIAAALLVILLLGSTGCANHGRETVLFNGHDTSAWQMRDGSACAWPVRDGYMASEKGDTLTREAFRDFKLHLEFWLPAMPATQERGKRANSGVYLQGRYEIQILDSHGLSPVTYQDCGSIYHQRPPDTTEFPPPETWQAMDITFRAARFDEQGQKTANARVTVILNGKVVQNDQEILGPTKSGGEAEKAGDAPIRLQCHTGSVRFRNIRIVRLDS